MSLWSSYKSLNPRTRLFLGLGLMANAALALQFSDQIERVLGLVPSVEDQKRLDAAIPKVRLVERDGGEVR